MYCHDLDVMSSNPVKSNLGCVVLLYLNRFFFIFICKKLFTYEIVCDVLICFGVQINEIQSTR